MTIFQFYKTVDGKHHWCLFDDGKIIADSSEGYDSEREARLAANHLCNVIDDAIMPGVSS